jgi:hypothetical protein
VAQLSRNLSIRWHQFGWTRGCIRRPHAGRSSVAKCTRSYERCAANLHRQRRDFRHNRRDFALGGATDGTGGADHGGCDYQTGNAIEVCASFGNSARVSALFEAELSECSMRGNLCGVSTGEALSRWCAAQISNNALSDFATAPQWVQDGMPDFVDQTDPTDQNADSIGCGMAFLSWLLSQGYGLDKIAQGMVTLGDSGTLAQLYSNLTSGAASSAWSAFQNAVKALPNGVANDDPFGTGG